MAKVILICGKLCCGKSTYAERLCREIKGVLLSVDEIMLALFGPYTGERHDEYAEKLQRYLLEKSVELIEFGHTVILDWGFWTRDKRDEAKAFYRKHGIDCELHYLAVKDEIWSARLRKRNREVAAGAVKAYPVDEGLAAKFEALFQAPDREEIDSWVEE